MKAVYEVLQITPEGYKSLITYQWLKWTEKHAVNHKHWQTLILNKSIFRWYKAQVFELNLEFFAIAQEYKDLPRAEIFIFYLEELESVTRYYPKTLLRHNEKPKTHEPILN